MANTEAYSYLKENSGRMSGNRASRILLSIWLLILTHYPIVYSQSVPEYDEISVTLDVPRLGTGEINAVIKGEVIYLPVTDLFDFLKIRNIPSQGLDNITGFFISPEAPYRIDLNTNTISYNGKILL